MDGVFCDSEYCLCKVVVELFVEMGYIVDDKDFILFMGIGMCILEFGFCCFFL